MKRLATAIIVIALFLLMMPTAVSADSSIIVASKTGDGVWIDENTWQIEIFPGEAKSTTLTLYNLSNSSLDVEVTIIPDSLDNGNLVFELDKVDFTMSGKAYKEVTLSVEASGSATPGTYTTELTIKSEIPPKPSPSKPTPTPIVVKPEEEKPVEEPEIVKPEPEEPAGPEEPIPPTEPEEPEIEEPEAEEPEEPGAPPEPEREEPEDLIPAEKPEPGFSWGWIIGVVVGLGLGLWGIIYWREKRENRQQKES